MQRGCFHSVAKQVSPRHVSTRAVLLATARRIAHHGTPSDGRRAWVQRLTTLCLACAAGVLASSCHAPRVFTVLGLEYARVYISVETMCSWSVLLVPQYVQAMSYHGTFGGSRAGYSAKTYHGICCTCGLQHASVRPPAFILPTCRSNV